MNNTATNTTIRQRFASCRPCAMTREQFLSTFDGICENSPWVMREVWAQGINETHDTIDGLHAAICATIDVAPTEQQDALLNAHPRLASKQARAHELGESSNNEQQSVGLDALSDDEYVQWEDLNHRYSHRFGFPFIMAVKGKHKKEILSAFVARLENSRDEERATALSQVKRIILLRLQAL